MKNRINSLFLSCEDSAKCCDRAQYNEASIWEKIRIHIHIAFCKPCREYTSKNVKLTKLIKKANIKTCTEKEKEKWEREISSRIKK